MEGQKVEEKQTGIVSGKKQDDTLSKSTELVPAKELALQKIGEVMIGLNSEQKTNMAQALMRLMMRGDKLDARFRNCTTESKLNALVDCAVTGLMPFTAMNEAYIIPYGREAKFQFGYRGIIKLFLKTGFYMDIYAKTVREKDYFKYEEGLNLKMVHRPLQAPIDDRGGIRFFYAVYKTTYGGKDFAVIAREDMEKHRDRYAKTNLKDPEAVWNKEFEAMGLKTAIVKVLRFAPKSQELIKQISRDMTIKRELAGEPEDFTEEANRIFEDDRAQDVTGEIDKKEADKIEGQKQKERKTEKEKAKTVKTPEAPKEKASGSSTGKDMSGKVSGELLSELWKKAHNVGMGIELIKSGVKEKYQVAPEDLTIKQYNEILGMVDSFKKIDK